MTIVSIKTGTGAEVRRIELSDGSLFSFKTRYLPPAFIDETLLLPGESAGREISGDEEAAFRFAAACLRAEKAALQLIARAEQNTAGLRRKLEKRGHCAASVRAVLSCLAELTLLDDRRYARRWLESRISSRACAPRRLLAALCARGIDRDDAQRELSIALDGEAEFALLQRYARKITRSRRYRQASDAAFMLKYALKGEGFSGAAIQRYFEEPA